jgi:hypothetical protein
MRALTARKNASIFAPLSFASIPASARLYRAPGRQFLPLGLRMHKFVSPADDRMRQRHWRMLFIANHSIAVRQQAGKFRGRRSPPIPAVAGVLPQGG